MVQAANARPGLREGLRERAARAERMPDGTLQSDYAEASPVALWDNVDGAWTKPFSKDMIGHYLRMEVVRCSDCTTTSVYDGGLNQHWQAVKDRFAQHKNAEMRMEKSDLRGNLGMLCSGCGSFLQTAKNSAQRHLAVINDEFLTHRNPREIVMLRYSVGPPASAAPVTALARANGHSAEPVEFQVERKRRRHRNRRRSR